MVNLRRLHRYFAEMARDTSQEVVSFCSAVKRAVRRLVNRIHRRLLRLPLLSRARRATAPLG